MFALFYSDVTLIRHDADDAAFAWVEFYLPGVFPFSERVKVFLNRTAAEDDTLIVYLLVPLAVSCQCQSGRTVSSSGS